MAKTVKEKPTKADKAKLIIETVPEPKLVQGTEKIPLVENKIPLEEKKHRYDKKKGW